MTDTRTRAKELADTIERRTAAYAQMNGVREQETVDIVSILRMVAEARELRLCQTISAFPEIPLGAIGGRRVLVMLIPDSGT